MKTPRLIQPVTSLCLRLPLFACFIAASLPVSAQLDFSIRRPAVEPWSGADVIESSGSSVRIAATDLGLSPSDEVNAFSYGDDEIEPVGIYNFSRIAYSVGRGSQGSSSAITAQAQGNGPGGDKFQVTVVGFQGNFFNVTPPQLLSDAPTHNLSPRPDETELDGLSLRRPGGVGFPVYFTLRGHASWGPADILVVTAPGAAPQIFATAAQLGLVAGDEIDALAIGTFPINSAPPAALGPNVVIWVSLKLGSPSASLATAAGGDGVIQIFPGPHQLVMDAKVLGLAPEDELDAITGLDPGVNVIVNPQNGHRYAMIPVDGSISWEDAKRAAEAFRIDGVPGHLVTITSQGEQDFVAANFRQAADGGYWIGAFQEPGQTDPNAGWGWVTGEVWAFTFWLPGGEPNDFNGVDEDRGALHGFLGPDGNPNGYWNDGQRWTAPGFIIEWDDVDQPWGLLPLGTNQRIIPPGSTGTGSPGGWSVSWWYNSNISFASLNEAVAARSLPGAVFAHNTVPYINFSSPRNDQLGPKTPNPLQAPQEVLPAGFPTENFAFEASSYITIPKPGDYTFYVNFDDGGRLSINGQVVVEMQGPQAPVGKTVVCSFSDPGTYPITLECYNAGFGFTHRVLVSTPDERTPLTLVNGDTAYLHQFNLVGDNVDPIPGGNYNFLGRGPEPFGFYQFKTFFANFSLNSTSDALDVVGNSTLWRTQPINSTGLSLNTGDDPLFAYTNGVQPPSSPADLFFTAFALNNQLDDFNVVTVYTGKVIATETAKHYFSVSSDDGTRFTISESSDSIIIESDRGNAQSLGNGVLFPTSTSDTHIGLTLVVPEGVRTVNGVFWDGAGASKHNVREQPMGTPGVSLGVLRGGTVSFAGAAGLRTTTTPEENNCPIAMISSDSPVVGGAITLIAPSSTGKVLVTLDGSHSSDPDNDSLTYTWTIGPQTATGSSVFTELAVGSYPVSLTVNDGTCSDTESLNITVGTPSQAVNDIRIIVDQSNLTRSTKVSLAAPLNAAASSFDQNRVIPGLNQLNAFQNQVAVKVPSTLAQELTGAAQEVQYAVTARVADLNSDGVVNSLDLVDLKTAIRNCANDPGCNFEAADVNFDGKLDSHDLQTFIGAFKLQ